MLQANFTNSGFIVQKKISYYAVLCQQGFKSVNTKCFFSVFFFFPFVFVWFLSLENRVQPVLFSCWDMFTDQSYPPNFFFLLESVFFFFFPPFGIITWHIYWFHLPLPSYFWSCFCLENCSVDVGLWLSYFCSVWLTVVSFP